MNCCNFIYKTPPPSPPPTLHPNFKSLNPNINNFEILNNFLKYPLKRQPRFSISTTPSEEKIWNKKELEFFRIIPEKIDRIYYINIHLKHMHCEIIYYLLARQDYKGRKLYIEMHCVFEHFPHISKCIIFISFKRNLFLKLVSHDLYTDIKMSICQFIEEEEEEEDGFCMEKFESDKTFPLLEDFLSRKIVYKTVPLLKDLCREIVYRKVDRRYWEILPKILRNDLDDQDAFEDYIYTSGGRDSKYCHHIYSYKRQFYRLNHGDEIRIPIHNPFHGSTECILI